MRPHNKNLEKRENKLKSVTTGVPQGCLNVYIFFSVDTFSVWRSLEIIMQAETNAHLSFFFSQ